MYLRLEVLMGCFWPARMRVIFNLMSRAALAGFGQVRCGNGGGSWVVLGAHEKGSRASRGDDPVGDACAETFGVEGSLLKWAVSGSVLGLAMRI